MATNNNVDPSEVEKLFDDRAKKLTGINAVLSSSDSPSAAHKNSYRDYITRNALLSQVKANKEVTALDFGCGMGRLTTVVAPLVKQVDAFDISNSMIEKAIELSSGSNIAYQLLTPSVQFKDLNYDLIFTCWVLQHVENDALVNYINMFHKCLKQNGKVIIIEQVSNDSKLQGTVLIQRTSEYYLDLFKAANFTCIKQQKIMRYPSYGMSLWDKYPKLKSFIKVFGWVEKLTMNRKIEHAEYFSELLVFQKN